MAIQICKLWRKKQEGCLIFARFCEITSTWRPLFKEAPTLGLSFISKLSTSILFEDFGIFQRQSCGKGIKHLSFTEMAAYFRMNDLDIAPEIGGIGKHAIVHYRKQKENTCTHCTPFYLKAGIRVHQFSCT